MSSVSFKFIKFGGRWVFSFMPRPIYPLETANNIVYIGGRASPPELGETPWERKNSSLGVYSTDRPVVYALTWSL